MEYRRPCWARPRSRKSRQWPSSNLTQRTPVMPAHGGTLQPIVAISHETRPSPFTYIPATVRALAYPHDQKYIVPPPHYRARRRWSRIVRRSRKVNVGQAPSSGKQNTSRVLPHQSIFPKLTLRIHQRQHGTPRQERHDAAVKMVTNERKATRQSLKR